VTWYVELPAYYLKILGNIFRCARKIAKATVSHFTSFLADGTVWLQLDRLSRNFTFEDFSTLCKKPHDFSD
jgi:hypothetical protein